MLQCFWEKKVVCEINMKPEDVADELRPLPLFIEMSWNHYVGLYYEQIKSFFASWAPYPLGGEQFYITIPSKEIELNGSEVVGHLCGMFGVGVNEPISMTCHYRSEKVKAEIDVKKIHKNNLKSSTCIRYSKYGATVLTVQMSIENVDKMFEGFVQDNLQKYLGSDDFDSEDLGYEFLVSKSEKIPIRVLGHDIYIERAISKDTSMNSFVKQLLNESQNSAEEAVQINDSERRLSILDSQTDTLKQNWLLQKYHLSMHGVRITRGEYPLSFFDRYSHPDGYLYLYLKV